MQQYPHHTKLRRSPVRIRLSQNKMAGSSAPSRDGKLRLPGGLPALQTAGSSTQTTLFPSPNRRVEFGRRPVPDAQQLFPLLLSQQGINVQATARQQMEEKLEKRLTCCRTLHESAKENVGA